MKPVPNIKEYAPPKEPSQTEKQDEEPFILLGIIILVSFVAFIIVGIIKLLIMLVEAL